MFRKSFKVILVLLLCAAMIGGCGKGSKDADKGGSDKAEGGGASRDDIILAIGEEPVGLSGVDPMVLEYRDWFGIYETLTVFGEGSERNPDLAESIDISEDGITYTIKLKQGVKFHNGEVMTADDILYSLDYLKNSDLSYMVPVQLETCEKKDDATVVMTLNAPFDGFLDSLTNLVIVNQKAVEEGGESYSRNPVGTGPYKFVSWQSGQSIVVERNDDYHGDKAKIKTVTYRILPDKTTELLALEKGEVDMVVDVPVSSIEQVESLPNVKLDSCASPKQLYFFQNTRMDKNVRQAIAYAIDKEGLLTMIEGGRGHVAKSHFEDLIGYSGKEVCYPHDVDKAKELLAGQTPTINILISTADDERVAQIVQNNLLEVGIKAEIESLENSAKDDKVVNSDFDLYYRVAGFSIPDMYDFTYGYSSDSSNNRVGLASKEYDDLINQVRVEPDLAKREALYDKVMEIIHDEAIVVPIYFADTSIAYNNALKNVKVDRLNYYDISKISW